MHPRERYHHELAELEHELLALGRLVDSAIQRAIWALRHCALSEARAIIRDDDQIDEATSDLEAHALQLIALQGPVATELRLISAFIRCAYELERMGDHAEGIARLLLRSAELPDLPLPPELLHMATEARALLQSALDALVQRDPDATLRLKDRDDIVDAYYQQIVHHMLEQMRTDPALIERGTYLLWIAHSLERIADRTTNIAGYVEFIVSGRISSRKRKKIAEAGTQDAGI